MVDRNVVISARGLGKRYLIGHQHARGTSTLRDRIADGAASFRRNLARTLTGKQLVNGDEIEEFWALKGVDLDIRRGETVGIIGRNGAGKSTLLKVLSRITEPTSGRVDIKGRIASLLEVGTGFHPELSGRENIFLNGAILGMSRAEVRLRFDEIVEFAGVERFLDTPVKRYSSGMYVRLAFAVAAHLEPEILSVDEVLAVGDAEFQKKCLGRMREVAGEGRTLLFVSHNMAAIRQLCTKGVFLQAGQVNFSGSIDGAIGAYQAAGASVSDRFARDVSDAVRPKIVGAAVRSLAWDAAGRRLELELEATINAPTAKRACLDFRLKDQTGNPVGFASSGALDSSETLPLVPGLNLVTATLDVTNLAVGTYMVSMDINVPWAEFDDRVEDVLQFEIRSEQWRATMNPLKLEYGLGAAMITSTFSVGA
jgi:lipopolysaccharide transport system ATP-binding protein